MSYLLLAAQNCATCKNCGLENKKSRWRQILGSEVVDCKQKYQKMIFYNTDDASREMTEWLERGLVTIEQCEAIEALVIEIREACVDCHGREAVVRDLIRKNEVLKDIIDRMKRTRVKVGRQIATKSDASKVVPITMRKKSPHGSGEQT